MKMETSLQPVPWSSCLCETRGRPELRVQRRFCQGAPRTAADGTGRRGAVSQCAVVLLQLLSAARVQLLKIFASYNPVCKDVLAMRELCRAGVTLL